MSAFDDGFAIKCQPNSNITCIYKHFDNIWIRIGSQVIAGLNPRVKLIVNKDKNEDSI